VKFGVGWAGDTQACQVNVFGDGTIQICPSGIEIGQGLTTKVAQGVAYGLGLPDISLIRVASSSTSVTPNAGPTGGSVTSALCVAAALEATKELNQRLAPVKTLLGPSATWLEIVLKAMTMGISLSVYGWFNPPSPTLGINQYNSYSACVTQVQVDVLTGEVEIERCDILYDCGITLSAMIDIGQIQGAFVMGLGYYLTEEIIYDTNPKSQTYCQLQTDGTWEYKPIANLDIPIDLRVTLLKDAPNPMGVMSSKCTGEPPLALSCSVLFAVQHAIAAARSDIGFNGYFSFNAPATVDNIQQTIGLTFLNFNI